MPTGILYFSRVPRNMRPQEIRDYFSRFGEIFRHKFSVAATNTKAAQMLRKKVGKTKSLRFSEGWVEFNDHKDAKNAALQTNAQPVQVKRRRMAAGEMWNVKCLPEGYRWEDLVTEIEGDKRMRRIKINAELQRERDVNEQYRQLANKEIVRRKKRLMQLRKQQQQQQDPFENEEDAIDDRHLQLASAGDFGADDADDEEYEQRDVGRGVTKREMKLDDGRLQASNFTGSDAADDDYDDENPQHGTRKKTSSTNIERIKRRKKAKMELRGDAGSVAVVGVTTSSAKRTSRVAAAKPTKKSAIATPVLLTSSGCRDLYNS